MQPAALKKVLTSLTEPQKAALQRFVKGVKRSAFPDINPRTAAALWSKALIKGEIVQGARVFLLTEMGEQAQCAAKRDGDES